MCMRMRKCKKANGKRAIKIEYLRMKDERENMEEKHFESEEKP